MSLSPQLHEYPFYFVFTDDSALRVPRLPDEVHIAIMEHLTAEDLRRIFQLSRRFRRLAYKAGLTIHRTITYARQVSVWAQIVEYALSQKKIHKVTFRLSLDIAHYGCGMPRSFVKETLSAVSRALPLLTRLRVNSSRYFTNCLLAALDAPAPLLHTLEIRHWDTDMNLRITSLPPTLFDGQAAFLHAVALTVPVLASVPDPVPALSRVTVVHLTLGRQQRSFAIARLFPAVKALHLRIPWAEHAVAIDLSQLELRVLVIDNSDCGGRSLEFTCCNGGRAPLLAAVEHTGPTLPAHDLLWPAYPSGLTGFMRLHQPGSRATVELSSADASWRLTAHIPEPARWKPNTLTHLQRVPLVSLTVDEALFDAFVRSRISLPQLRELSVVFSESAPFPCISMRYNWDSSVDTVHAVFVVSLSITGALEHLFHLKKVFSAPLARVALVVPFLCVLAAVVGLMRLHQNGQRGDLTRVPKLERVILCADKGARPVLCAERIAPVLNLLAHSLVRPKMCLACGVQLDLPASLMVLWRTLSIPVSVPRVGSPS